MKFNMHKGSILLQVEACASKVDNLASKMKEQTREGPTAFADACLAKCGSDTVYTLAEAKQIQSAALPLDPSLHCKKQCYPTDVICGAICNSEREDIFHYQYHKEQEMNDIGKYNMAISQFFIISVYCKREENKPCYKCMDKCANGAAAVAVTSFAIFFSIAIASLMM